MNLKRCQSSAQIFNAKDESAYSSVEEYMNALAKAGIIEIRKREIHPREEIYFPASKDHSLASEQTSLNYTSSYPVEIWVLEWNAPHEDR